MSAVRIRSWAVIAGVVVGFVLAGAAWADTGNDTVKEAIKEAIKDGELELDLRYRYEWVSQDGFDLSANANTLRARVGWTTGRWHGLFANVGLAGNFSIDGERYNSTANGQTQYPVVPDPDDQELNTAWLAYGGPADLVARVGRQRVNLDNQRFIGSVSFRQLEQTLDAFRFDIEPVDQLSVFYAYAGRVHRVFGDHNPTPSQAELDMDSHLFNVAWKFPQVRLTGYGYLLEFESDPSRSSQSIGLRATGNPRVNRDWRLPFTAEYADQSQYGNAPSTNDADYAFAEVGVTAPRFEVRLAYEVLGGDGTYGFQTPLATLFKFNGNADKFLTTPPDGLRDAWVWLEGKIAQVSLFAVYHDFSADHGGADYGTEWDFWVSRTFHDTYLVELRYANYNAEQFATDTEKFWFTLGLKL